LSLADETPADPRLRWRLSVAESAAYGRRFTSQARRTVVVAQILLLLGTAAAVVWIRWAHPLRPETLMSLAWFVVPAVLITELWSFTRVRPAARKMAEAARHGLDVAVLLPSGVRIGPLPFVCGDQMGFPRPELRVEETLFPPLLLVTGTYREGRRTAAYALEVPIAHDAIAGVKDWIAEEEAKHLAAIQGNVGVGGSRR